MMTNEEGQEPLVAAFLAGRVKGADPIKSHVVTPLSHVFVGLKHTYKLKRAVRLPFVDLSSPMRRAALCMREFMLNVGFAPNLYLFVAVITADSADNFILDGEGPALDAVVVMRRFNPVDTYDHRAETGLVTMRDVESLAEKIALAHQVAEVKVLTGHAADYRAIIHELQKTEQHGAAELGLKPGASLLLDQLDAAWSRVQALIEGRHRNAKTRRCHGDLHLRNICQFEGEPTIFDALEFDERLATIDVLYDLAFLLMDLRAFGLLPHLNRLLNSYWDRSHEPESALAALPFFMALRAAVKVAVLVQAGALTQAQRYRAVGLACLEPIRPQLVLVGGLSGVGKSKASRALAPHLPGAAGARVLSSDNMRKRALQMRQDEKAPDNAYTPSQRAAVYRALGEAAGEALRAGMSVVVDATFAESSFREVFEEAADFEPSQAFWLHAPTDVRLARISQRGRDVSDITEAQAARQREPTDLGPNWRLIDVSVADAADRVAAILGLPRSA